MKASSLLVAGAKGRDLEAIRILEEVYKRERIEFKDREVPISALELPFDGRQIERGVERLVKEDLLWSEKSVAGYQEAMVSDLGHEAIEDLLALRQEMHIRTTNLRDRLLVWIYNNTSYSPPILGDFRRSQENYFYGEQFRAPEVAKSSLWLKDHGFISGEKGDIGGIIRPVITETGKITVERGQTVNKTPTGPQTQNIHTVINGNGNNFAAASSNVRQSSSIAEGTSDAFRELVNLVQELAASKPAVQSALQVELDAAQAAHDAQDSGLLRNILERIKNTISTGVGSSLGTLVVTQVDSVIDMLP